MNGRQECQFVMYDSVLFRTLLTWNNALHRAPPVFLPHIVLAAVGQVALHLPFTVNLSLSEYCLFVTSLVATNALPLSTSHLLL